MPAANAPQSILVNHRIALPGALDLDASLAFCAHNITFEHITECVFDCQALRRVEPFGMLLVAGKIRRTVTAGSRWGTSFFFAHHDSDSPALGYAAHIGFFQSTGLPFGKLPGQAPGSNRYIPITAITRQVLEQDQVSHYEYEIGPAIERRSKQLAELLAQNNTNLTRVLTYCIREIIRNAVEHSGANQIWIAGQYWPSKDLVEIAICDEGVGIRSSLTQNPNLEIHTDEDALDLALRPGISGKAFRVEGKRNRRQSNEWDNSGYGLYLTSKLCQLAGEFVIGSGNALLEIVGDDVFTQTVNLPGTAIRVRFKMSQLPVLEKTLPKLLKAGEKLAVGSDRGAVKSASKSSSMLTEDLAAIDARRDR